MQTGQALLLERVSSNPDFSHPLGATCFTGCHAALRGGLSSLSLWYKYKLGHKPLGLMSFIDRFWHTRRSFNFLRENKKIRIKITKLQDTQHNPEIGQKPSPTQFYSISQLQLVSMRPPCQGNIIATWPLPTTCWVLLGGRQETKAVCTAPPVLWVPVWVLSGIQVWSCPKRDPCTQHCGLWLGTPCSGSVRLHRIWLHLLQRPSMQLRLKK